MEVRGIQGQKVQEYFGSTEAMWVYIEVITSKVITMHLQILFCFGAVYKDQ